MKLLDRLMARQARLMASLDAPHVEVARRSSPVRAPAVAATHTAEAETAARDAAVSLVEAGEFVAACGVLEPFMASGRDVGTLTTLARIYTEQRAFAEALTALQRAEALDPADRKVWRLSAKLLSTQGHFREALVYQRRLALADANAPAVNYVNLLRALLRSAERGVRAARVDRAARAELQLVLRRFESAPGNDDSLRLQFAGLYYLLSQGSQDALRLLKEADPCPPDHHDVTATLTSLTTWSTEQGLPFARVNDQGQPGQRPSVYALQDVQVHPALGWIPVLKDGAVLAAGHVLDSRYFRGKSSPSPLMLFRGTHAELRLPRELPRESGPALLIGGSRSAYETLLMHVAGLAIIEATGSDRSLPLVVDADMSTFQLDLLAWLGYAGNPLIRVATGRPVQFDRLHVPSRLVVGAKWFDPMLPRWYQERAAATRLDAPARKLYVLPGADEGVVIANAGDVADVASSLGYETVDLSALSLSETIARFASATHLLGATSEALSPLVFAPAGATVHELRPAYWAASGGRLHFAPLCGACGHRYAAIESALAGGDGTEVSRVVVDVDALRRSLRATA